MKKRIIILAGILAVIAAASVLWAKSSPHEVDDHHQTITWSTNELKQSMAPEESKTLFVSFRSRVNLSKTLIVASSSIDEVVSVNPESFNSIQANKSYQISVTFKAPKQSRREEYNGIIELKDTPKIHWNHDNRSYAEPLKVELKIDHASTISIITWSTTTVSERLSPKGNTVVPLTFTSSVDLKNVTLSLSPELAPFISVQSNSFSSIQAGKPQTFLASIYISADTSLKTYDGTIQIRGASSPPRTYPQPLSVILKVASSNGALPPDPGEVGKLTLLGIDTDGDGVRDDVQRYITLSYPSSAKTRSALSQTAIAAQLIVSQSADPIASRNNMASFIRGQDCLAYVTSEETAIMLKRELRAQILNTKSRTAAWLNGDLHNSGHVGTIPTTASEMKAGCVFDPDGMGN
jgi:hypothetical protein